MTSQITAFFRGKQIATGQRDEVALSLRAQLSEHDGSVLIFDDLSGRVVDLDYRTTETRSAGRPKLGVQAREVTLLPRHWEWLSDQSGGASAALRGLVEEARSKGRTQRECRDAAYRFMQAACGDLPEYEEALRALYSARDTDLIAFIDQWPEDFGLYIRKLLAPGMDQTGASPCE